MAFKKTAKVKKNQHSASYTKITPELLSSKNNIDESWIAYEGIVYDVTHWLPKHPGGIRSLMSAVGHDATSVMKSLHSQDTLDKYLRFIRKVGLLSDSKNNCKLSEMNTESGTRIITAASSNVRSIRKDKKDEEKINREKNQLLNKEERTAIIEQDFLKLNEKLIRDGWFEPRIWDYWCQIIRILFFFTIGVYLILHSQNDFPENNNLMGIDKVIASRVSSYFLPKSSLIVGSIFMGLFLQNIAFMGHDAGHGSISGNIRIDFWLGLILGNALTGIDVGWWKSTHNVHHSATNSLHDDPDIQHMPFLCFEERMVENRWSNYHGKFMPLCAIGRKVLPYQHLYFYPLMAVARINLYIQSFIYLYKVCPFRTEQKEESLQVINERTGEKKKKYIWSKLPPHIWISSVLCLGVYYIFIFLFLTCLDINSAVTCVTVSHFVAGILHVQIILSHIAMHYCANGAGSNEADISSNGYGEVGYYEWQALSTMDIACPQYMDWFHGGLQFQLEHHLFPRIPRWNLRKLMPLVDEIYHKHGITVVRKNFFEGNSMILNHMARIGSVVVTSKKDK